RRTGALGDRRAKLQANVSESAADALAQHEGSVEGVILQGVVRQYHPRDGPAAIRRIICGWRTEEERVAGRWIFCQQSGPDFRQIKSCPTAVFRNILPRQR